MYTLIFVSVVTFSKPGISKLFKLFSFLMFDFETQGHKFILYDTPWIWLYACCMLSIDVNSNIFEVMDLKENKYSTTTTYVKCLEPIEKTHLSETIIFKVSCHIYRIYFFLVPRPRAPLGFRGLNSKLNKTADCVYAAYSLCVILS